MADEIASIFYCSTYLEWMKAVTEQHKGKRGYHKAMAKAAGCQSSFLSQVQRGSTHLTPDQAAGLCEFWNLNANETEYFISLVHFERSGSKVYRRILAEKIEQLRINYDKVSTRVPNKESINLELQAKYYSDWYWSIIHIMTSIEKYSDPLKISETLNLDYNRVIRVLKDLSDMNLVTQVGSKWSITSNLFHQKPTSPFYCFHQRNFRHFLQSQISSDKEDNLHFCATYGLSKKSYMTIRKMLLSFVETANQEVMQSKEEQIACISLDLIAL